MILQDTQEKLERALGEAVRLEEANKRLGIRCDQQMRSIKEYQALIERKDDRWETAVDEKKELEERGSRQYTTIDELQKDVKRLDKLYDGALDEMRHYKVRCEEQRKSLQTYQLAIEAGNEDLKKAEGEIRKLRYVAGDLRHEMMAGREADRKQDPESFMATKPTPRDRRLELTERRIVAIEHRLVGVTAELKAFFQSHARLANVDERLVVIEKRVGSIVRALTEPWEMS